ncbi:MAG: hypothetical protein AB7P34_04990 [Vicinamibacterales bacterium]
MRVVVTLVMVAAVPVVLAAQLPRDLGAIARKLPSLDRLLKGSPPLSTDFDDTVGQQPILDRRETVRPARPLRSLARTSSGGFILKPGLWEDTFQSYCLRPGTYAPGKGDGYLYAPVKGSRATAIRTILSAASRHPAVTQSDIQMLLWGILSYARIGSMPPKMQAVARVLLPASEIRAIDADAFELIGAAERNRLFRGLPAPVRRTLEVEADLRYRFSRATVTYEEVERIAVLSGAAPEDNRNAIRRGQWSRHPRGYYVRYFPDSFARTRVQVLVPEPVVVTRDRLNRIVSIADSRGGRTETVYNDAVPPREAPAGLGLRAYAFKTVRFVKRGANGAPEVFEVHDKGWTFHRSRPRRQRVEAAPVMGFARVAYGAPGWFRAAAQDWFDRWFERAEQAQDIHDRYDFYRERADRAGSRGDADSVDELEDSDHYREGIDAATRGDLGDRLDWIIDHQERENAALEHATTVLDGLPTTSTTGDPAYDPWDGLAVPSGGGQRLGISGR